MTKKIMHSLTIQEISAVDSPAQKGATVAIMKRDQSELKKGGKAALTAASNGHTHLVNLEEYDGMPTRSGCTSWENDHCHPFVVMENGDIVIGESRGHKHEIDAVGKVAQAKEESDMTTVDKDAEIAKAKADVDAATAKIAELEVLAGMTDVEKAHYATLEGDVKAAFGKLDSKARGVAIEKAAAADAIVYTDLEGSVYRKSDDPRLIAMAKRNDESAKKAKEAEELIAKADLEKRAATISKLPGKVEVHVALLKAVDGIADAEVRKAAHEALVAANTAMSGAYVEGGQAGGSTLEKSEGVKGAEKALDDLVKVHMQKNGLPEHKSYVAVLATDEGKRLYAESQAR